MEPDRQARNWAMAAHLSALAALTSIPLANVLGPLVVWLMRRGQHPFVDAHAREALNFQISVTIYAFALAILLVPVALIGSGLRLIPLLPLAVVAGIGLLVFALAMMAMGAMRAGEGAGYRYPLSLRLVR